VAASDTRASRDARRTMFLKQDGVGRSAGTSSLLQALRTSTASMVASLWAGSDVPQEYEGHGDLSVNERSHLTMSQ
jgi:hypothetical protein